LSSNKKRRSVYQYGEAKFQLGKIKNKNLIIDIIAYACSEPSKLTLLIYSISKQMRCLAI
jgi:hypothetical protein